MSNADLRTLAAFRYALRKFLRFSEQAATSAGLTPQHYLALLAVHGFSARENVTLGVLAERMQLCANSAVGLADRLAGRGLVCRRPSPEDRRKVHLVLTTKGSRAMRRVAGINRRELTRLRRDIIHLLRRLGH